MTVLDFLVIASSIIAPMYLYAEGVRNGWMIGKRKMIVVLAVWLFPALLSMNFGTLQGFPLHVKMLALSVMCALMAGFIFYSVIKIRFKAALLKKHF